VVVEAAGSSHEARSLPQTPSSSRARCWKA